MDKLKKYIICGFKILTSWKIIVLFLGLTFITYYIQMNRYVIHYPEWHTMVVHDRIMNETCMAYRDTWDALFDPRDMYPFGGCEQRFMDIIQGYQTY